MKPAIAFFALAACAQGQTEVAISAQGVGGELAYGAPTLAAAKRAFFGEDDTSGGGGSSGGGGDSDLIGPQDPVRLHGFPPTVTAVTLSRTYDLHDMALRTSATAGYQHLHGTLPNGLGVLTDPIGIEVWAQSLGLQMTLGQRQALPGNLHLDYDAGVGVTGLQAATHLQSDLLDVRGSSLQTLTYLVAEGRLAAQTGPALLGSVLVFSSGATEARLGIEQAF